MAESAEGARLLSECRVTSSTEGSNPSLSATTNREADVGLTSAFLLITKARKCENEFYFIDNSKFLTAIPRSSHTAQATFRLSA
jgi:hypothetical protein